MSNSALSLASGRTWTISGSKSGFRNGDCGRLRIWNWLTYSLVSPDDAILVGRWDKNRFWHKVVVAKCFTSGDLGKRPWKEMFWQVQ